jgi:hypothetical protein
MATYGGTPEQWLRTPIRYIVPLLEQIRGIEAERILHMMTAVALGSGTARRGQAQSVLHELRRAAEKPSDTIPANEALPVLSSVFEVVKE